MIVMGSPVQEASSTAYTSTMGQSNPAARTSGAIQNYAGANTNFVPFGASGLSSATFALSGNFGFFQVRVSGLVVNIPFQVPE